MHGTRRSPVIVVILASFLLLHSCDNPLAEVVDTLQAETISPRIAVLRGSTAVDQQTGMDLGTIAFNQTLNVSLTIQNSGRSRLVLAEDAVSIEPDALTGTDIFSVAEKPSSIDLDESSTLTVRINGTSAGTKRCDVIIASNDVTNPAFRIPVVVVVSPLPLPDAPEGFRADNLATVPAMYTCIRLSWSAADSATLGYVVCRDVNIAGNYDTRFNYTPASNTGTIEYIDTSAVPGATYYYKILSRNALGTSSLSSSDTKIGMLPGTPVTGMVMSDSSRVMGKGTASALTATILPAGASIRTIAWTSDAPGKVSVDASGNIAAVDYGRATITARSEDNTGITATCVVDVRPDQPVFRLNGVTVASGSTQVLTSVPASLSMTALPSTAVIRYTMDGSTPDADSMVFDPGTPINIAGGGLDLLFKAAAFDANGVSSSVGTVTIQIRLTGLTTALDTSSTVATLSVGVVDPYTVPMGLVSDGTNIYIADENRFVIWKVNPATGATSVFAGALLQSDLIDGVGGAARFYALQSITTDGTFLYVTDRSTVRRINIATAKVETLAGDRDSGYVDGAGNIARFHSSMQDITTNGRYLFMVDYIDSGSSYIRKLDLYSPTFEVQTLVYLPHHCSGIASDGTYLYISAAMSESNPRGVIWRCNFDASTYGTIAGNGLADIGSVDGTGTEATFNDPWALVCDGPNLYVLDHGSLLVRKMVINTRTVSTIQNTGLEGWTNGLAIQGNSLYFMKRPTSITAYLMRHQ